MTDAHGNHDEGRASDPSSDGLRRVLANLLALQLQAKQAQWTAAGPEVFTLRQSLDTVVTTTMKLADRVADRIRALGGIPDGRAPTIVATADLTPYPLAEHTESAAADLISARLRMVADVVRGINEGGSGEDPATAELLGDVGKSLEADADMVGAENGSAHE